MYCGDMVQGKRKTVNNIDKKLDKSEWTVTENTHEAIIDREIFEKVQELWVKPEKSNEPYYKAPVTENLFPRKVFCGDCGFSLIRKRNGEYYYGFKCNSKKLYSSHACGGVYITEKLFKKKVFALLRKHESFLTQVMTQTADTAPTEVGYDVELAAVKSELDRNTYFLKGLYESLINSDITDCEYKDMKSRYEAKIISLIEREKQLRDNAYIRVQNEKALSKAHKSVQTVSQISDLSADAIDKLIEKIHVYKDKRIKVKFHFMDEEVYCGEGSDDE